MRVRRTRDIERAAPSVLTLMSPALFAKIGSVLTYPLCFIAVFGSNSAQVHFFNLISHQAGTKLLLYALITRKHLLSQTENAVDCPGTDAR